MNAQTHTTDMQTGITQRWLNLLEENNVKFMALDPMHDRKLIQQLQTHPDWIVEFADEEAIFFARAEMLVSTGTPR